jgi:hypothetical protein
MEIPWAVVIGGEACRAANVPPMAIKRKGVGTAARSGFPVHRTGMQGICTSNNGQFPITPERFRAKIKIIMETNGGRKAMGSIESGTCETEVVSQLAPEE